METYKVINYRKGKKIAIKKGLSLQTAQSVVRNLNYPVDNNNWFDWKKE